MKQGLSFEYAPSPRRRPTVWFRSLLTRPPHNKVGTSHDGHTHKRSHRACSENLKRRDPNTTCQYSRRWKAINKRHSEKPNPVFPLLTARKRTRMKEQEFIRHCPPTLSNSYVEIKCVKKKQKTHTLCNTGPLTHYQTHTNSQSALHHVPEL